jgi:NADPH oxidase 1
MDGASTSIVPLAEVVQTLTETSRWKQATDPRLAGLNTLTFSVWISRGAGLVLTVDGTLILLPVCRTIVRWIRPKIRWLPLDENLWFHRQVAYSMLLFTVIHTAGHYVK